MRSGPFQTMTMVAVLAGCGQAGPSGTAAAQAPTTAVASEPAATSEATRSLTPSLVPARPTGAIAFLRPETPSDGSQVDIYLVDAAGGEPARLTNDSRDERALYWTIDGSRLVYTWQEPGPEGGWGTYHQELASVRPDGTDRRDLGPVQTLYAPPAHSPDRRSIVFSGDGTEDEDTGLILLDLVTGSRRQLTTHGETGAVWSPDGSKLVAYLPSRRVVIIDAASGAELARISDPYVQEVYGWTADGLSVIYDGCADELNKDECTAATSLAANADGTNVRPYTDSLPRPPSDTEALSPDGRWIASWGNGRLEVSPSVGGSAVLVAELGGPATWSPDSAWLVFSGQAPGPVPSGEGPKSWLFLVPREGGDPMPLTRVNDSGPAWQPG